jgi:hypothetical protein
MKDSGCDITDRESIKEFVKKAADFNKRSPEYLRLGLNYRGISHHHVKDAIYYHLGIS